MQFFRNTRNTGTLEFLELVVFGKARSAEDLCSSLLKN